MKRGSRCPFLASRWILAVVVSLAIGVVLIRSAPGGDSLRPSRIRRSDRYDFPAPAPETSPRPVLRATPSPIPPPASPALPLSAASPSPAPVPELPIVCEGDRVRFLEGGRRIIGEGNVRLQYREMRMTADRVEVDVAGKKAVAEGEVRFYEGDRRLRADRLYYDLESGTAEISPGRGYFPPWYGGADKIEARGGEYVEFQEGYFTTCDLDHPHYHLAARRVEIYPGDRITAHSVTFYAGRLPLFWIPVFWRSLKEDCGGFYIRPGYRSRWGAYLLSGYQWCAPGIRAALNLDWRYHRGFAYGFEGDYEPWARGRGDWRLYYADDRLYPSRDRYLAEFSFRQSWPGNVRGALNFNLAGDQDFRREFFRREYDADKQPRSFAYLGKSWPEVSLSVETRFRVNEFEAVTERLPEVRLQTRQRRVGESDFYYELDASLVNFQKRFADLSSAEESSVRGDAFQRLSYNRKFWGWLNFFPSIGFRQSYYSRGPGEQEEEEEQEEGREERDLFRRVFSAGLGLSTAIYGVYPARSKTLDIDRLRHVIEPSVDYVFVDNPSLRPDRIYHYDDIERIGPANHTRLGLRNQLQTMRTIGDREQSWTLADLFLRTNLYTDPDRFNQGRLIDVLSAQLRFNPVARGGMRLDLLYDTYDAVVNRSTLGLWAGSVEDWQVTLNHVYRRDRDRNSVDSSVFLRVTPKWAFEIFARFDLADSRFDEESITIRRDLHCWDSSLTVRRREARDETEVYLALWIKAFPQAGLRLSN